MHELEEFSMSLAMFDIGFRGGSEEGKRFGVEDGHLHLGGLI